MDYDWIIKIVIILFTIFFVLPPNICRSWEYIAKSQRT